MSLTTFENRSRETDGAPVPAVLVRDLHKSYGDLEAVAGIDLEIPPGELFGFLGPNGAGKSTTIKVLCTLVRPTSGSAQVSGFDVVADRSEVRRHIGLVFQEPTLDEYLTAEQNLTFHAEIYGMPRAGLAQRMDAVLALVGLAERRADRVSTFSGGMKRRLEIARGLLHSPRVLFLDEPTIGLDPESRLTLWKYVDELRLRENITVFLTTHYMDEAERCDRIAIVENGKIAALGTPAGLKASVGQDRVHLRTANNAATAQIVESRLGVKAVADDDGVDVFTEDGEAFIPRLFEIGLTVRSVKITRPTLDDVFLAYTGNRLGNADKPGKPGSRASMPGPWSRRRS
jgi:ABC-2 type transport system ATP-binding protein